MFKKGHKKVGGRKKGTPNVKTSDYIQIVDDAFYGLGGLQALIDWAKGDPANLSLFYTRIFPKIIPTNVNLEGNISYSDMVKASYKVDAWGGEANVDTNNSVIEGDRRAEEFKEVSEKDVGDKDQRKVG